MLLGIRFLFLIAKNDEVNTTVEKKEHRITSTIGASVVLLVMSIIQNIS